MQMHLNVHVTCWYYPTWHLPLCLQKLLKERVPLHLALLREAHNIWCAEGNHFFSTTSYFFLIPCSNPMGGNGYMATLHPADRSAAGSHMALLRRPYYINIVTAFRLAATVQIAYIRERECLKDCFGCLFSTFFPSFFLQCPFNLC